MKPFDIFICYKKSSGKDFAEHLKVGLEELGLHSFIDSKDIPQMINGKEQWAKIRDQAVEECKTFILIMTPGFELSPEVIKELSIARKTKNKEFIYFRHRNLGRKIVLDLENERVDLGKQQQVSFETKEELLRLAHNILCKGCVLPTPFAIMESASSTSDMPTLASAKNASVSEDPGFKCVMCSKPITGKAFIETFDGKKYNFDSHECALTYKKLKSLYGTHFE